MVFEFIVASLVFFAIIIYILNYINMAVFSYNNEYGISRMESHAMKISELLVKDKGLWNGIIPKRVGLAREWPVLDKTKINNLESYCSNPLNYKNLLGLLNLGGHVMKLHITNENNDVLLDCGPDFNETAKVIRYGIDSETNSLLKIVVKLR